MTFCLVTCTVSPHMLPLAARLAARLGAENFRYVATVGCEESRTKLGWPTDVRPEWLLLPREARAQEATAADWIQKSDVLLSGRRDVDILGPRLHMGRLTCYMSERWFKPPLGFLRLAHPGYLHAVMRFRRILRNPQFVYLPIGVHAWKDMARLGRLGRRAGLWGYFTEPPDPPAPPRPRGGSLRILWAGRMLRLKRVDTLISAVARATHQGAVLQLRLIGHGPDEARLRGLSQRLGLGQAVTFHPAVALDAVRRSMREADVYAFPSDGREGWGAVVNEAMSEGCTLVASREGGAAATLVQDGVNGFLFQSGNTAELSAILAMLARDDRRRLSVAEAGQQTLLQVWSPDVAADRLLAACEARLAGCEPPSYWSGPMMSPA